jgi:hypothetical protein
MGNLVSQPAALGWSTCSSTQHQQPVAPDWDQVLREQFRHLASGFGIL